MVMKNEITAVNIDALFNDFPIWNARVPNLSWTHYRSLLRVENADARMWYVNEANAQTWGTRTLDLKTTEITHQDIGQMDMYIRMYDDLKCTEGDNPTIGLVLCSETSADLAKYSILRDNNRLFAAKYLTYLPDEKELLEKIRRQKMLYESNNKNPKQYREP